MNFLKALGKTAVRHWKLVVGAAVAWAGISLIADGEYNTGKKDAFDIVETVVKDCEAFKAKGGNPDDYGEKEVEAAVQKWGEKTYGL